MEHYHWGLEGWFDIPQMHIYEEMVKNAKDGSHFVEIGAWKGKSTSCMAVEIINSGKKIKFDVVDTFKGSTEHQNLPCIVNGTLYQEYLANIDTVKNYVNTIVGNSTHIAGMYTDNSLDFVFVDGDHTYEGVYNDIMAWLPKVKQGGYICGNDIFQKGFEQVSAAVAKSLGDVKIYGNNWIYQKPNEILHKFNIIHDKNHLNFDVSFDLNIENAYVITVLGNENSETKAQRCINSLKNVGMENYKIFPAFDGTDRISIKTPEHLKDQDWIKWIKVVEHEISTAEVACTLSHIALWAHCMTINKPIIILEHDAVMLKKYNNMTQINCVDYLGHLDTFDDYIAFSKTTSFEDVVEKLKKESFNTYRNYPLLNMTNENYNFIMGNHAYAIDPLSARKLFMKALKEGITMCNDSMMTPENTAILSSGLYACILPDAFTSSTLCPAEMDIKTDISGKFSKRKKSHFIPGVSRKIIHPFWEDFDTRLENKTLSEVQEKKMILEKIMKEE